MSLSNSKENATAKEEIIQDIKDIQLKSTAELTAQKIYSDFQEFVFSNKIMVGATSFAIGVATKDVIEQIMTSAILPVFKIPLVKIQDFFLKSSFIFNLSQKRLIQPLLNTVGNISWAILLWITIIFFAFFLLEYILSRKIIGITSKVSIAEEKDFVEAKKDAKDIPVVPIAEEDIRKAKSKLIEERVKEDTNFPGFDKYGYGFDITDV